MRNTPFSETQFAFCFMFEYMQRFPKGTLPLFPNTVLEGRTGGGYDVEIDGNIFIQFKIPEYRFRLTHLNHDFYQVFKGPYYKVKIDTDSTQFGLLKTLQGNDPLNQVFYATPEFHLKNQLQTHYSSGHVVKNSALFPIQNFPSHRSGYHTLIYNAKQDWGKLFSQPIKIKKQGVFDPSELFTNSKEGITLLDQAERIISVLGKSKIEDLNMIRFLVNRPYHLVREVHSYLLTHLNIYWFPVISSRVK